MMTHGAVVAREYGIPAVVSDLRAGTHQDRPAHPRRWHAGFVQILSES